MSAAHTPEFCHCGRPLHYADWDIEAFCRGLVRTQGDFMPITRGDRTWLVQRHYIALHGVKADELPALGFREVTGMAYWLSDNGDAITCGKCHRTSHTPNDVAHRYCGHCHEFMEPGTPEMSGTPETSVTPGTPETP